MTKQSSPETNPIISHEELQALRAQLEQSRRMATIGELTSTTTHEFNNLLMTILNYAKMGLRHDDDETRQKAFERILDASNKATKITSNILAMARNRGDRKEPTDLKALIEDTLMLLEREFRKYRIQLEVELNDVPNISGLANDLQRMLVNLLVNARQATPEGGFVRVSLADDQTNSQVVLSIRDNGSGIAPEVLPKIFEPFFSTKTGPDASGKGGTGVGLASCKETIDLHQGKIRVESTIGKGTAFIIRLPVASIGDANEHVRAAG